MERNNGPGDILAAIRFQGYRSMNSRVGAFVMAPSFLD
jgi:hypothetical protein